MPTRNISLTDRWDRFIDESVSSGEYQNASEVVRDALRLLVRRQHEDVEKLERLRTLGAAGFAEIDRGEYVTIAPGSSGRFISGLREEVSGRGRSRKRPRA